MNLITAPGRARIRWNSISLKLAGMIVLAALSLTLITSAEYIRSSLRLLERQAAHAALESTESLGEMLRESVALQSVGPIERAFARLTAHEAAETRLAIAFDAAGVPIVEMGAEPGRAAELGDLARAAIASGAAATAGNGMVVAVPVDNPYDGTRIGAIATLWSTERLRAESLRGFAAVAALAIATVAGGIVVLLWVVRRALTRPMAALSDVVEAVAADRLDVGVAGLARGDELGDMARAVDRLRLRLLDGHREARENRFRGQAFAASSAAIMMVDAEMRISAVNATVTRILTQHAGEFRKVTPDFDPEHIIGREMDFFHAGALRERVRRLLSDPANLPYRAHISIGEARFQLVINRVGGQDDSTEGFVVEWVDVTLEYMNNAILKAIDVNQVKAEFALTGELISANERFVRAMGGRPEDMRGATSETLFSFDAALDAERGPVFTRLNAGDSVYGQFRLNRHDGRQAVIDGGFTPVLDTAGRLLRVILIGNDVTEARHALELANAERERLQKAQADVVEQLRGALGGLAEGDLTSRIETAFPSDYERLRVDFNLAAERLQDAMRGVIENADLIRGEAAEISSAADDLSARTERQAATLEQTASALDQLTSSVKSAADGASHANELVESARRNAEASGNVVREAVEAMGEIETSSKQISKITGVIDDIAFQTNLLALNAGVEAARAGEAGRGFAVVASEVRALAQRSSEAAREINALIAASGGQVKRGVDLVGQAGAALKGIVESVKDISRNVSEIAVSSQEQSSGLAEINVAVNQLDQVTQQNAAMFEQTTAASHALTREAEALTRTTARFRTGAPAAGGEVVAATFATRREAPAIEPARRLAVNAPRPEPVAPPEADDGWDEF